MRIMYPAAKKTSPVANTDAPVSIEAATIGARDLAHYAALATRGVDTPMGLTATEVRLLCGAVVEHLNRKTLRSRAFG